MTISMEVLSVDDDENTIEVSIDDAAKDELIGMALRVMLTCAARKITVDELLGETDV